MGIERERLTFWTRGPRVFWKVEFVDPVVKYEFPVIVVVSMAICCYMYLSYRHNVIQIISDLNGLLYNVKFCFYSAIKWHKMLVSLSSAVKWLQSV